LTQIKVFSINKGLSAIFIRLIELPPPLSDFSINLSADYRLLLLGFTALVVSACAGGLLCGCGVEKTWRVSLFLLRFLVWCGVVGNDIGIRAKSSFLVVSFAFLGFERVRKCF